jgi:nucleoside-diphosphate-sugar epimerase
MNILITGSNGFVGNYLAKKFSNLLALIILLQQTVCFS